MKITPDNSIDLARLERLARPQPELERQAEQQLATELAQSAALAPARAPAVERDRGEVLLTASAQADGAAPRTLTGDDALRGALEVEPDLAVAAELAAERIYAALQ